MAFLGVFLHAVGGFAAASFYIPFKRVRGWAWESYWLVGGLFSWVFAPWVLALLTVPTPIEILREAPVSALRWSYLFGVLWGIGGLTFGLSMRYLGMSLGYAVALGFCAAFGTIIPPLFEGQGGELARSASGLVTLAGVATCLAGIAVCGQAGIRKERELTAADKQAAVKEFSLVKGMWVALFAGVMSACMAFAIKAGKPIAELAIARGTPPLFQNTPVFIVILAGGFTANLIWCLFLNLRNHTLSDYVRFGATPWLANVLFAAAAGTIWYLQFTFYGMGTTRMGRYDFASWTIHMAFIIVFSNLWGLRFREWHGVGRGTLALVWWGIAILILSTIIVGAGTYLAG